MDDRGNIRELAIDESPRPGEIDVSRDAKDLSAMGRRARRDYYRAVSQGLSLDAALACAQATERAARFRGR
jgi:hypothetical protein